MQNTAWLPPCPGVSAWRTSHLNTPHSTARAFQVSLRSFCPQSSWCCCPSRKPFTSASFSFWLNGQLPLHSSSRCTILVAKTLPGGPNYSPVYSLLIFHPLYFMERLFGWSVVIHPWNKLALILYSPCLLHPYPWYSQEMGGDKLLYEEHHSLTHLQAQHHTWLCSLLSHANFFCGFLAGLINHLAKEVRNSSNLCSHVSILHFPALCISMCACDKFITSPVHALGKRRQEKLLLLQSLLASLLPK